MADERSSFLVQLLSNSKTYALIQNQTTQIIQDIIKQELGIEKHDLFLPKNIQAVTVYYIRSILDSSGQETCLKEFNKKRDFLDFKKPLTATIQCDVAFFGEWNDELVILLTDNTNALNSLNQKTKTLMNH